MNLYLNNRDYDIYTKVVYTYTFYLYINYDLLDIYTFTTLVKSKQSDYYNSCVKKFFRPDFFQKFRKFCTKIKKWLLRYIYFWWKIFLKFLKNPIFLGKNFSKKTVFFEKNDFVYYNTFQNMTLFTLSLSTTFLKHFCLYIYTFFIFLLKKVVLFIVDCDRVNKVKNIKKSSNVIE